MLSDSTCSELSSSDSSQSSTSDGYSFSASPSDFSLDTVSQTPFDPLSPADGQTVATVSLPREDPRVALRRVPTPETWTSSILDGQEEPQTVRKLVLRKRTTSPYQIKLPLMTDRLRVRNGKLIIHAYSEKDVDADPPCKAILLATHVPKPFADPPFKPAVRTSLLSNGVFNIHSPVPVYPPYLKMLDPDPSPARDSQHAGPHSLTIRISPPDAAVMPAADTWSEICEDLCRAMEVLSVLSDLDAGSLDPSPSTTNLQSCIQPYSLADFPAYGDHWNSYVFPRLVIS